MIQYGILTHGGAGSSKSDSDGCQTACERGLALLKNGASALDAVVEAARSLEDDGRFNAGSGSVLRLDGKTIQMDASLMDSNGKIGIVACIEQVQNPILAAREVINTPHIILCGQGATIFAEKKGLKKEVVPSAESRRRFAKLEKLNDGKWRENWNFEVPFEQIYACDTIGAVAIDSTGNLAVANSTGGTSLMLYGRVGDSPIIGCGFFAGTAAAVATTGTGEEIIRKRLANQVYNLISWGEDIQKACEKGVSLFDQQIPVGIIAISRRGFGIASNREMASWSLTHGS